MIYKDSKNHLLKEGLRPDIKNKHLTVVRFVSSVLGEEFRGIVNDYDFMRRKRNKFIYEPDIPCSVREAENAIKTAEKLVHEIAALIRKNAPQREFEF